MRILLLGGTTEASALARLLAPLPWRATLSYAGRTTAPRPQPIPTRTGGFGGADGLAGHLRAHAIDALVVATHPFAARIAANAALAAARTGTPALLVRRPEWTPQPGDRWTHLPSMADAARALGPTPRRVLLTIGQQELAPFRHTPHHYVIRSIEPPDAPWAATILTARPPFDEAAERTLLETHRIEIMVTKNAGGAAPKLAAARALGLPVLLVARPDPPALPAVPSADAALAWLHHISGLDR